MVSLEMNDEEVKVLSSVLENYHLHLEVEINHTDRREFREALVKREKALKAVIERLGRLAK